MFYVVKHHILVRLNDDDDKKSIINSLGRILDYSFFTYMNIVCFNKLERSSWLDMNIGTNEELSPSLTTIHSRFTLSIQSNLFLTHNMLHNFAAVE